MKRSVLFVVYILASVVSKGDDSEFSHPSLKGLLGVEVVVQDLSQSATDAGLTVDALRTEVELKLRFAGIKVLSARELAPGRPYLYVQVIADSRENLYYYSARVNLAQDVLLSRSPRVEVVAQTWTKGVLA